MSRLLIWSVPPLERFPRVSGDEPAYNLDNSYEVTFSPRERG